MFRFRAWFKPFEKLGANTITYQNTGGTDHQSLDAAQKEVSSNYQPVKKPYT